MTIHRKTWILVALSLLGIMALVIRWNMLETGGLLEATKYSMNASAENTALQKSWWYNFKSSPPFRSLKSASTFMFLIWNLFLAWIPFWLAIIFSNSIRKGRSWIISLSLLGLWLAFLPNAPYIITDLLHLKWRHPIPHWYDLMLLFIFAYTGLALGLASVFKVQRSLAEILSKRISWMISLGSLLLCGLGIYLGRVLRYNSWDLLHQPGRIVQDAFAAMVHPLGSPGAGMAWMMGLFLCLIYLWEYGNALNKMDN